MERYDLYDNLSDYYKELFEKWVVKTEFQKMGKKTTACLITLNNGFEVVGTSACVNESNFKFELGKQYSLADALSKLDELVGFLLQEQSK